MTLSNLAITIFDYAIAESKRTESSKVLPIHLLAGIRRWNQSNFDEKYPGALDKILTLLREVPHEGARPEGPSEETQGLLDKLLNPHDVWQVADEMLSSITSTASGQSEEKVKETTSSLDSEVSVRKSDAVGFALDNALTYQLADALQLPFEEIAGLVASDISVVTASVIGQCGIPELDVIKSVTDLECNTVSTGQQRSDLLKQLVSLQADDADTLSRQYALGLVQCASFAASMDEQVTPEEISAIDELRVCLREELANAPQVENKHHTHLFDTKFEEIIGLETVKRELRQRIDYFTVVQRRKARGLKTSDHSMHVAFLGNPGTGKTTVARLFANVLKEMNFLQSDKIIEVDRSGLVGEYMGHSEKKTNDVIDSALGGVLFIDEAYALADGYESQKGFGGEVIDVLVKRMEDDRERLMVVMAGYAEPMNRFLNINEGLKSGVPLKLIFPDYSADELFKVMERMAINEGFLLDDECISQFKDIGEKIAASPQSNNARDIRNIFEQTVRNQFTRIAALGDLATTKELSTLQASDIPSVQIEGTTKHKTIGFR